MFKRIIGTPSSLKEQCSCWLTLSVCIILWSLKFSWDSCGFNSTAENHWVRNVYLLFLSCSYFYLYLKQKLAPVEFYSMHPSFLEELSRLNGRSEWLLRKSSKWEPNQSKMPKSLLSVKVKNWGGFTSPFLQRNSLILLYFCQSF